MLTITKDLLVRYFRDQCSPEETAAAHAFIVAQTDPSLVETCMQEVFKTQPVAELIPLSEQDYQLAWQQFQERSSWQPPVRQLRPFRWLRYVAAAVLIAGISILGWQLYQQSGKGPADRSLADALQQIQADKGARKRIALPDGSIVHLFPGSSLSLSNDFNETNRSIGLKGRAFFEITKNPQQPFLVQTGQLTTRVLGTSFEVNGTSEEQIAVTVRTGMVGIHNNNRELTRLTPNQRIIYQTTSGVYTVAQADADRLCNWINGELVFDNTPLPEICRTLEQWYGATIQLDNGHWQAKKISVKFKGQPLSTVLRVLSLTSGFRYKLNGRDVQIY